MRKLLNFGNRYASESSWKDFALVKFCLFAMGLAAGTQVPDKYKKAAVGAAAGVFAVTYIPLMAKVFRTRLGRRSDGCQGNGSFDNFLREETGDSSLSPFSPWCQKNRPPDTSLERGQRTVPCLLKVRNLCG